MEVKLGAHVYYIVSMSDDHNNKKPQAIFFKISSSLLKLANGTMHGDETWYAHDDNSHFFCSICPIQYIVVYKNEWRQVNKNPANFKKEAYREERETR